MSISAADLFLASKSKFFPQHALPSIRSVVENLSPNDISLLNTLEFKDPTMYLVISIVGGTLGIDRFLVGDTAMGVLKLLTGGLCGILTIIDWFKIGDRAKEENLKMFLNLV